MQKNAPLTTFEGYSLFSIIFLFHIFNEVLPVTRSAGTASWMARGLSAIWAVFLLVPLCWLLSKFEGKDILQISDEVLGKFFGKLLNIALLLFFAMFITVNLSETLYLLINYSYPQSGLLHMNAVIIGIVMLAALYSMKGLGKVTSICTPIFMVCLILILISANSQYDIHLLTPIWGYGGKEIFKASFFQLSNFDAFLILTVFMGSFGTTKAYKKSAAFGIITAGVFFSLTALCVSMAFPYTLSDDGTFGLLELAHNIYINRYFQRFESVFIALLCLSVIMVIAASFLALKKTYCHVFGIPPEYSNAVVLPLGLIIIGFGQMVRFFDYFYYDMKLFVHTGSVFLTIAVIVLCLIVAWARKKGTPKKLRFVALFLIPCFLCGLFTGCLHYREPDEVAYGVIMGYDKGTNEQYRITLKVLDEHSGQTSGTNPENLFVAEAPSAFTALSMINTVMPKTISLLHVEMIVVSEELAREGIDSLIAPVTRYKETKSSIALVITRCSAQEFISTPQTVSTPLPMNTELFIQPYKQVGAYKPMTLGQMYNTYMSNYGDAITMYASVKPTEENEEGAGESGAGDENKTSGGEPQATDTDGAQPDDLNKDPTVNPDVNYDIGFLPGDIPIDNTVNIEVAGMAVFSESTMVGNLNTKETAMFMIIEGSYHNAAYSMRDPYKPENNYLVFRLRNQRPSEVHVQIMEDGTPQIQVEVFVKAQILIAQNTEPNYESIEQKPLLEQYGKEWLEHRAKELVQKTQQELGSDIWHFGRYAAGHFGTIQAWEEYDWRSRYPDAEINVNVTFTL